MEEGGRNLATQMQEGAGGFFGFREKEKRGKNMGRSEEGKNVGARGRPQILLSQSSVLGH